jgi:hypothetical protein
MDILRWGYMRRGQRKAVFDKYPNTTVIFRRVRGYFLVYSIGWNEEDGVVERSDIEQMEVLLNNELGLLGNYKERGGKI